MKVKVMNNVKKLAAVATGALFLGATVGAAAVFGSGLSALPLNLVHNGAVNAVVVVGANSQATDVLGSIDIASALTASAAASHVTNNGVVELGVFGLATNATSLAHTGSSSFTTWSPSTVELVKVNYQGADKENYSAVENVTFLNKPVFDGLNVIVPAKSLELVSSVVNRSNSNATVGTWTQGLEYEVGTTLETLVSETAANYTVGVVTELTNPKVPSTLTVGANTVALQGIATVGTNPSTSYYELEYAVNGGASNYTNLTGIVSAGPVTMDFGTHDLVLTNSSGTFLAHLGVSSVSTVQNWSSMNKFGLGAWNTTTAASPGVGELGFVNDANETLDYSFSTTSSFSLPSSLKSVELEPLTHTWDGSVNNTVQTGASETDVFTPEVGTSTGNVVGFDATDGLPNVAFGVVNRSTLGASGYGAPNLLLESNETYFNLSATPPSYVHAGSEYIFPTPVSSDHSYGGSAGAYTFEAKAQHGSAQLVYELPNGQDFALLFSNESVGVWNATSILFYTATTTGTPNVTTIRPGTSTYQLGGYNLTLEHLSGNGYATSFVLSGPVATVVNGRTIEYSMVPGYSGLYSSTGQELSVANYSSTDVLGTLSFSGSVLTYTDPLGATQTVTVAENKSDFATSIALPATANTTANTWGDFVDGVNGSHATFAVPAQNYTLALGGSSVLSTTANYTSGDVLTASANERIEVVSVGGSSLTASGLFGSGVFPLAEADSSFVGRTNSVPVVVVGGPAVNSLAQTLLGVSGPVYGANFTKLTNVSAGEALVQWFANVSAFGGQNALWVAGYNPSDTLNAAEVVAEALIGTPVVALNGTKMVLSTSASSYTGVRVVSES